MYLLIYNIFQEKKRKGDKMKFDVAKATALISVARMAAGAAAGDPTSTAQAANTVAGTGSVYNTRTVGELKRVIAYSAIVAGMRFASAPTISALPTCLALFMATMLVMTGYVMTLRQNPLGTGILPAVGITLVYGLGLASVVCALNLAVGHPLDVSLLALATKIAMNCGVYLVICWICDKVLKKCRRL